MEKAQEQYRAMTLFVSFALGLILLMGCGGQPQQPGYTGNQQTPPPQGAQANGQNTNTTGMLTGTRDTLVPPPNNTSQSPPPTPNTSQGNVNIQSVPSQADIYLVNSGNIAISQYRQTPASMAFQAGKYTLQLSKSGYYNCLYDLNVTGPARRLSLVFHLVSRSENIPYGTESCQVGVTGG